MLNERHSAVRLRCWTIFDTLVCDWLYLVPRRKLLSGRRQVVKSRTHLILIKITWSRTQSNLICIGAVLEPELCWGNIITRFFVDIDFFFFFFSWDACAQVSSAVNRSNSNVQRQNPIRNFTVQQWLRKQFYHLRTSCGKKLDELKLTTLGSGARESCLPVIFALNSSSSSSLNSGHVMKQP